MSLPHVCRCAICQRELTQDFIGRSLTNIADTYQTWAVEKWFGPADVTVAVLGVAGEAGEVAEKYKKKMRGDNVNDDDMKKELGDVLFYIANVADSYGWKLSDVMQANYDKLEDRHGRGQHRGEGDNR